MGAKTTVYGHLASPADDAPEIRGSEAEINPGDTAGPATRVSGRPMLLGYARVSTSDGRQVTDRQEDALREAGCDRVFIDHVSGAKASRPQLDALWNAARAGDIVVVQSLDRLGRDTRQLLQWADELRATGIHLRILQLGVDTATPAGAMVFTIVAALAEHERQLLRARVKDGLVAAKARGRVGGRPASLSEAQKLEVIRLRGEGRQSGEIAELFACSTRTVRRTLEEHRAAVGG
ncbi:MAG: invertase [Microbacteriaceae bacterium]|nr:invertase [Microbacteriaceae bacterium]